MEEEHDAYEIRNYQDLYPQPFQVDNGPLRRRRVWILSPVITTQLELSYTYTKYKFEYTNHDCLYSSEWQSVPSPPGMNPGSVIDVHEDRVEEELS